MPGTSSSHPLVRQQFATLCSALHTRWNDRQPRPHLHHTSTTNNKVLMASISASWIRLVSNTRLQRSSQTLAVIGSKALIFGGEVVPRQPVDNHIDAIDLKSDNDALIETLQAPSSAPSPRVGSAGAAMNGNLCLFSGRGGVAMAPVEEQGGVWLYSSSSAAWNLLRPADVSAPYPAARSYHAATSDGTGTLYIHAGCPEKGRLSDLWSFDVGSKVWRKLAEAPAPPRGGTSIAYLSRKLYRMNGFDGTKEQGGHLDVYSISDDRWTTLTYEPDGKTGPEPRSVSALLPVKVRGRDYLVTLFGEHDPSSLGHAGAGKMLGNVWAFDVENNHWSKVETKGDVPAPRGWFDADVAPGGSGNDEVIVHGGLAEDNSRLGDVWKLRFD